MVHRKTTYVDRSLYIFRYFAVLRLKRKALPRWALFYANEKLHAMYGIKGAGLCRKSPIFIVGQEKFVLLRIIKYETKWQDLF